MVCSTWSRIIHPVAKMCEDSNISKDICLHIYIKRALFQLLADEEERDSFLLTFWFCFQSHRNWMQN